MSAQPPQPTLAWQFESSNVDYVTGLAPNLSTTGTYAAQSGGSITTVAGQRIHTFTSVGTTSITFLVPVTAQVLVVAGGGGGGGNSGGALAGGGGGAGEYYNSASYSIDAGTYTVTVGDGGTAGVAPRGDGGDGGTSVFGSLSANGGGGGSGGSSGNNGRPGGSGGGSGRTGGNVGGASVKTAGGLGNKGGDNTAGANFSAGGGGGSASAGTAASATGATPVPGGSGTPNSISSVSVTYASGGTGGARTGTYTPGAGTPNQGDGGDGAPAGSGTGVNGAVGGSGIVIISYASALYPAPTYVPGIYRQAISFDNQNSISSGTLASNSYVTYTGGALSAMTSNSFTMAAWVNPLFSIPAPTGNQAWVVVKDTQRLYNLSLNTSVSTTNPFFYTSSSPSVRIDSSSSLATGVWFHQCVAFSNVGATSSNTLATYYFNGVSQGSSNVQRANGISVFNSIQLAGDGTSYGAWVSIDDLRLFNTALSAAQVQTIYAAQGMPNQMSLSGSGTIYMNGSGTLTLQ